MHSNSAIEYLKAFKDSDLLGLKNWFSDNIKLTDWNVNAHGIESASQDYTNIFQSLSSVVIEIVNLYETNSTVSAELLTSAKEAATIKVVDILSFDSHGKNQEKEEADVLINATPIGMCPDNWSMPVCEHFLDSCRAVMDMVMSPFETKLIQYALLRGKLVAPGYQVGLEQVKAQFFLYTGVAAPPKAMQEAMKQLVGGEGMQSEPK